MENNKEENILDSRNESAIRNQEQIFGLFDSGKIKSVKNVFKEFEIPVPEEYIDKIALYQARALELQAKEKEEKAILTPKKKEVVIEKVIIEEPKTEIPRFDLTIDYDSINGAFDYIDLPSLGKTYKSKIDRFPVAFLTAKDESLFMQQNLYKTKDIFNLILKKKILIPGIDPKTLHHGDKNAILLFLRANAFGVDYHVSVTHPDYEEPLRGVIDLTKIKRKQLTIDSDENGYFDYKFNDKRTGDEIIFKFKFFNDYDTEAIEYRVQKDIENGETEDYEDTYRAIQSVVSVNGNSNREYVEEYVSNMSPLDYRKYKNYVIENEPGIDLNYILDKATNSLGGGVENFPIRFNIGLEMFLFTE